jgi:hypothetical protein
MAEQDIFYVEITQQLADTCQVNIQLDNYKLEYKPLNEPNKRYKKMKLACIYFHNKTEEEKDTNKGKQITINFSGLNNGNNSPYKLPLDYSNYTSKLKNIVHNTYGNLDENGQNIFITFWDDALNTYMDLRKLVGTKMGFRLKNK